VLEDSPDNPEANYRYGLALLASGQNSLAKWSLRKALDSPQWLERAGIPLATTAIQLGGYDEAVEVATRVLEQHPDNVDALMVRADARIRTRREYEEALADAERALQLDPENRGAMVPKVAALLALERTDEAAAALDSLERAYSDESLGLHGSPALCTARATFAKEKGDLDAAEEAVRGMPPAFSERGNRAAGGGGVLRRDPSPGAFRGDPEGTRSRLRPTRSATARGLVDRFRARGPRERGRGAAARGDRARGPGQCGGRLVRDGALLDRDRQVR
jgi:Tfp pilus assembly protein PilF